ncbi:MAG: Pycsar system effector family protein [Bacilli bacterium]
MNSHNNSNDVLEILKKINDRLYEQLVYAETKHAILIGFSSAAIFGLTNLILKKSIMNMTWLIILLGSMILFLFFSILCSLISFYPIRGTKDNKFNIYFYGNIEKIENSNAFIDIIKKCDNSCSLADQNIVISKIITRKHNIFQLSLILCICGLFLPFVLVVILKLLKCFIVRIINLISIKL